MAIGVRVEPDRLAAPAGSDVSGRVVITNPHQTPVHVRVVVSGEIAGWSTVEPVELVVPSGEQAACALRIRLPRGAPGGVGEVPFLVRALSDAEGIGGATAEAWLAVEGQAELALRILPGITTGSVGARVKVAADNLGDVPARAQIEVTADVGLSIAVEPDSLIIEPKDTAWARVVVRPTRRRLAGPPHLHDFRVRLEPMGGVPVSVEGQFLQRSVARSLAPMLASGALLLVAVVAMASIFGGSDGEVDSLSTDVAAPPTLPAETTSTPPASPVVEANVTTSTVLPRERRVAFQSKRDGNFEVYSCLPDGSEPVNLSRHPGHDSEPAWSPDGARLAFDSDRSGNFDIWVMNADGSGLAQLTSEPAPDGYPSWSPDGSRLAFISFRDGNSEIYVMNADGSGQVRLTKNLSDDARPVWSPDSTQLAFHTDRDGNYEVYVMNADGSGARNLTSSAGFDKDPAWSPDGARIAFDSTRDGGRGEIYLIGADGSLPVRLTSDESNDAWPDWSPDGRRLVFQSDRDGDQELYSFTPQGGTPRRLTDFPGEDAEPNW